MLAEIISLHDPAGYFKNKTCDSQCDCMTFVSLMFTLLIYENKKKKKIIFKTTDKILPVMHLCMTVKNKLKSKFLLQYMHAIYA